MRKISFSVAVMCVGMFLMSCGSGPEKRIIGKWGWVKNEKVAWEFFRDGTLVIASPRDGKGVMDYAFLDKKHIKIIYSSGEKDVITVSFSRNKLILEENIGTKKRRDEYRRVK